MVADDGSDETRGARERRARERAFGAKRTTRVGMRRAGWVVRARRVEAPLAVA
jgi:hypothetical protein